MEPRLPNQTRSSAFALMMVAEHDHVYLYALIFSDLAHLFISASLIIPLPLLRTEKVKEEIDRFNSELVKLHKSWRFVSM